MRKFVEFPIKNSQVFQHQLLGWAGKFKSCCFLNSNGSASSKKSIYSDYDFLAGIDHIDVMNPLSTNFFEAFKTFYETKKDWLFGHLSYDLKNELEPLQSTHPDYVQFPLYHFFQPRYVFVVHPQSVQIGFLDELTTESEVNVIYQEVCNQKGEQSKENQAVNPTLNSIRMQPRVSIKNYLNTCKRIKQDILKGEIYEMNYCQEFYAEQAEIDPLQIYLKLNEISQAPFSCFYHLADHYLISSSPERFLKKKGDKLISQPIKGTMKRGNSAEEDQLLKHILLHDLKEKSENVMIVDLVRNDLSKTAEKGSVKVEELCGIYTFNQVHQLISTISSVLKKNIHFVQAIQGAFPMGSMTGAPKIRAMELIEKYEESKRGLYSGAVGYVSPEGNFDFNVVIRSLLYNQATKYLSLMVGSAITEKSDPEKEHAECLLKAKAIFEVLEKAN